jgi:pimeloyl-ACP methyl ester carboxylesterase
VSLRPRVVAAVVRKDLHALWPMAAVAVLLVLADIVVAEFGLGSEGGSLPLRTILPFVMQLSYCLLVVAVVQQDTAVSTTHDWLTKPISRLDMVVAKAVFVALTMLAPIALFRAVVYTIEGYSVEEALLTALHVDWIWILLALPLVVAVAAVTSTLLQAAAVLIGLFMVIFVVPTFLRAVGIPSLDEAVVGGGVVWVLLWIAMVAAIGTAAAAVFLTYGRRSTGAARAVLGGVPLMIAVVAPVFLGWPQLFAIQKAVAPDPPPGEDFVVKRNAGCFPAESAGALLDGAQASSAETHLLGARLWNKEELEQAGPGAIAFSTGVAARDLPDGWHMRVSHVEATYVDQQGRTLESAQQARVSSVPRMTLEGRASYAHFWLLPSTALERLKHEPTARLALDYSLSLLKASAVELAADGVRRHLSGLGYCGATYDPADSTIAIDCFKRGTQPAMITADIPGAPLRTAETQFVNYEPAWLQTLTGQRYKLTLTVPAGVDRTKVKLTSYTARSHFERRLEAPGVLGGTLAECPLPTDTRSLGPVDRSVWRDSSPHNTLYVNVADGVRLEVLDWGGAGRPILLLHGLGATAHGFDDFAPKLAQRYRVYGITRRGNGASTLAESGYDVPRLTEDVVRVLDALEIDSSVVVAGSSIAGMELDELGARHSERIAGLVYLDAAADRTLKPSPEYKALMNALPDPPVPKPEELASYESLRDYTVRMGGVGLPEGEVLATFAFTPSGSIAGRTFDPRILDEIEANAQRPDYAAFRVPALALNAIPRDTDDVMRPWYDRTDAALRANVQREYEFTVAARAAMKRGFLDGIPRARAVDLLGAKHMIYASNEADVLAEIDAFVASLPTP